MAQTTKLYPPSLSGTLPSFYLSEGAATIAVPFSMNQSVSRAAINGFALQIKRTTTDQTVDVIYSTNWDTENSIVTFNSKDANSGLASAIKKMTPGNFFRLQLAYYQEIAGKKYVGYYSNAAIAKYTREPGITILELEPGQTSSVNTISFTGQYSNEDPSEKVYEYRFVINSSWKDPITHVSKEALFLDTDWLVHDSTTDTSLTVSTDYLELPQALASDINYTFQYMVITNNGLKLSSIPYSVVANTNEGDILELSLHADLDYENARMKITFVPIGDEPDDTVAFNGTYYLQRAEAKSDYTTWTILYTFNSSGLIRDFIYYDYSIESGVAYKYGLQQINASNILSQRITNYDPVLAYFEDCYLYDGKRQLRIRYNANISSFKEVIAETKKTTLGSKYPLIFRNGTLCYKEFPITGLLSYLSDEDELFMTHDELISPEIRKIRGRIERMEHNPESMLSAWTQFITTTNPTDENIMIEKNFAMFALSWLNNGDIKLFKSPQEGNFIVKCINTSLSPFNGTNRMIHQFSTTADEVQPYSADALSKYNLLQGITEEGTPVEYSYRTITVRIEEIRNDLYSTYMSADMNPGLTETQRREQFVTAMKTYDFSQGNSVKEIHIQDGPHGQIFEWGEYSFALDPNGSYDIERDSAYKGPLHLISVKANNVDYDGAYGTILLRVRTQATSIVQNTDKQRLISIFGWSGFGHELADGSNQSRNLLREFRYNKWKVKDVYKTIVHSYPIDEQGGDFITKWNNNQIDKNKYILLYGTYVLYKVNNKYYRYNPSTGGLVEITPNTTIRTKSATANPVDITSYGSGGEDVININYNQPSQIYWSVGNDVFATYYFQVQENTFAIEEESDIREAVNSADDARKEWYKRTFNLQIVNTKPTNDSTLLFIWRNGKFNKITVSEWSNYVTDQGYEAYTIRSTPYTRSQILSAYNSFWTAQLALETILNNRL